MNRKLIGTMALVAVGAVLGGCATPSQMIAESKLESSYCDKEGAYVFEVVNAPVAEWYPGFTLATGRHVIGNKGQFTLVNLKTFVFGNEHSANIVEYRREIYRNSDSKLLGYTLQYAMYGGNFPLSPAERIGTPCKNYKLPTFADSVFNPNFGSKQ